LKGISKKKPSPQRSPAKVENVENKIPNMTQWRKIEVEVSE